MAKTTHNMGFLEETADQVVLQCSDCKRKIGFAKDSAAIQKDGKSFKLVDDGPVSATIGLLCDK